MSRLNRISWSLWIVAWLVTGRNGTGALLFNQDLVWDVFFEPGSVTAAVGVSLLVLAAVYGPLIAGVMATRADAFTSLAELRIRVTKVRVGARWYVHLLLILMAVTVVPGAVMIAVGGIASPMQNPGRLGVFFTVLFGYQLLTGLLTEAGPLAVVVTQLLLWAVVIAIASRHERTYASLDGVR